MKILGIGNALVDILVRLEDEKLLQELGLAKGGMILASDEDQQRIAPLMERLSPQKATGGSAGNVILALAHLQDGTGFVGSIGNDANGQFFAQTLQGIGAETRLRIVDGRATGTANTFITRDGERTFATHLGAACCMQPQDITPEVLQGYDLLHVEGYLIANPALLDTICRQAKALGMLVSIDLASFTVVRSALQEMTRIVDEYVDIVFANQEEAEAFTSLADPLQAARQIAEHCQTAVVKMGGDGACVMQHGATAPVQIPAQRVPVVDTTAAGDFFAGGFLYAYGKGMPMEACLGMGARLAAEVIQVIGTQVPTERWEAIRNA